MTYSAQRHLSLGCRCVHIIHRSSLPRFAAKMAENAMQWNAMKTSVPTSTEAPRHNCLKVSKFWNSKSFWTLFGGHFWLRGSCPFFQYSLVAWGLTTSDVSNNFPASFFTVMPKGLTTGPKSRTGYGCRITTHNTASSACFGPKESDSVIWHHNAHLDWSRLGPNAKFLQRRIIGRILFF